MENLFIVTTHYRGSTVHINFNLLKEINVTSITPEEHDII